MARNMILIVVGTTFAIIGSFVLLEANTLATQWLQLPTGAWTATEDLGRKQSYHVAGLICLCFGLLLMVMGTWTWKNGKNSKRGLIESA